MGFEDDFRGPETSSASRAFAAGGADVMRARIDDLVTALRGARDDLASFAGSAADELDEKLEAALEAAEDVRDGLGKMVFVSRDGDRDPSNIDVHEPLETALRMTRALIGRRARIVRRYERVPAVLADKTALTRVFAQLLQNAADAIPPYMPLANCVSVRTYRDMDGFVAIELSDTGIGIATENVGRVFEPFYTTKSGAADGLGLTIVRGEVTAAGGTITIDSIEGQGTRITIKFPPVSGSFGRIDRVFTSEMPHRRVMVIADEAAKGERLRALVRDDRTVVVVAESREAVERLAMGEACDLVVVDPDDDGAAGLRERLAEVAPDVVMKMFELCVRRLQVPAQVPAAPSSGLWSIAVP
jgi:hypothetical protein